MNGKSKTKFLLGTAMIAALCGGAYFLYPPSVTNAAEEHGMDGPPPPMPVEMESVSLEKVQIWKNFSGHIVAVDQADIRPQVSGIITEIKFEDGQHVNKGDVLIVIDPRPYEASLNQAKAELDEAMTKAALAEKEYQRARKLINSEAISQSLLDERANNRKASSSEVEAAKSRVQSAEINLDYANIKAPISGKISRAEITEGNLVQASAAPLLTSIVSDTQVYVDFEIDERTYLNFIKEKAGADVTKIPVVVRLLDVDLEYTGQIHSFDNRIDRASGTMRARAIFDNKDGVLLPGMSVSVMMGSGSEVESILLTERAIGTDQDRKFVFLIGEGGVAEYREVEIGESVGGKRVILSGLNSGDKVITEGLVRIRPGMAVTPKSEQSANASPVMAPQAEEEE